MEGKSEARVCGFGAGWDGSEEGDEEKVDVLAACDAGVRGGELATPTCAQ